MILYNLHKNKKWTYKYMRVNVQEHFCAKERHYYRDTTPVVLKLRKVKRNEIEILFLGR